MPRKIRIAVLLIFLLSCIDKRENEFEIRTANQEQVKISLAEDPTGTVIVCSVHDSVTSRWPLYFPVYKFSKGDVNNDGQDDIAVGVIKPTRNDSIARKRLFLFQVRNNSIIPLWLGSSLSHPLEDFEVYTRDSVTYIRSIEKEVSGQYLVGEYQWFGFGLSFRKYILREAAINEARDYLSNK